MTNVQTFVYDGVEVKKTGREAQRPMGAGRVQILVEITPVSRDDGDWKKFVSEKLLFLIVDSK